MKRDGPIIREGPIILLVGVVTFGGIAAAFIMGGFSQMGMFSPPQSGKSPSCLPATPYSTSAVPEFPSPPAAPADTRSFDTLPGVQAPILSVTVPNRDPAVGDIQRRSASGCALPAPSPRTAR
jgi:hypothetical protein